MPHDGRSLRRDLRYRIDAVGVDLGHPATPVDPAAFRGLLGMESRMISGRGTPWGWGAMPLLREA